MDENWCCLGCTSDVKVVHLGLVLWTIDRVPYFIWNMVIPFGLKVAIYCDLIIFV